METWFVIKKATIALLACMFFASSAHAKLIYCSSTHKTCMPLDKIHVYGIKGLLYESLNNLPIDIRKQTIVKYARAIVWLEKAHNDEKKHKLEKTNSQDANLIKGAIEIILNLISKHDTLVQESLARWTNIGQQVVAEYAEKDGKISWKLYLKKETKK